jgi:hypothetical protein
MNRSALRIGLLVLLTAFFCGGGTFAFAQGSSTQTISGTVVDGTGAVIPGADVAAKHAGTGIVSNTVSNSEGQFSLPGMQVGTYAVTVTLQGFKTVIINNVVITSGAGASVKATLEVGGVSEQVTVSSSSEIVQTQSSTVSTTINTNQITKLPITSRSAMDFVNLLPGVSTPSGNRDATINGLPRGTINITLDGVNIQDNTLRSTDGFFAIVSPRLDAIEEVTVQTATQGADSAGQGAVQIKFVTRGGTNSYTGSGYEYFRSDKLNANTWFNNRNGVAKPKLKQNQFGGRFGGPIVIPGLFDGHNKAFFFVNYEEFRQPADTTRNRTILNPAAQAGTYNYPGGSVNVLTLAANNGQISSVDPTIGKLLTDIRTATGSTGSVSDTDANLQRFSYNLAVTSLRRYPTARVDYNFTNKHRFTSAYNYQKFTDLPDTLNSFDASFPGFPVEAGQSSVRLGFSNAMRSNIGANFVNEARVGYSGAPVKFFDELSPSMFSGSLAPQAGFHIFFPSIGSQLTSACCGGGNNQAPAPQSRNATSLLIEDTVTWLKGAHTFTMGGSFTQFDIWMNNSNLVPRINTGVSNNDPAFGMFNATTMPGASAAQIGQARDLYGFLTGRVTTITGDARLDSSGTYNYMGVGRQEGRLREIGGYIQDQWRMKQNFTVNAGVRYDIQYPFSAKNSSYTFGDLANICGISGVSGDNACNLFRPGVTPGLAAPVFQQLVKGSRAYNVDYDNIAPTVGASWVPQARPGFIGTLMGEGDFVVRAGYTRSFSRGGLNDFTGLFNANPGVVIQATRSEAKQNLGALPLLLRDTARLGPPAFSATPTYPMTDVSSQDINGFDPNIQVPYADSWQAGITRSLGKSMALEVRYVGTRGRDGWVTRNYNEQNIVENGFLDEFRKAQANLQANIAAGRGATFAFTGAPGTSPLPIFAAHYNGVTAANAGNAALYTGGNWTNATFLGFLAARNPNPFGFASTSGTNGLVGNPTFRNAGLAAGIPVNFWIANPALIGGANVRTNGEHQRYNSLQMELRRRLSQGLQFGASYVFGNGSITDFQSFRQPLRFLRDTGTPGDITHQIKTNIVYDLPFGRGRRFGGNANGFVDRLIGGWQLGVASRIQSGRLIDLGNVRLVGMSEGDVRDMFKLRFDDAGKQIYNFPQDVIDNSILAFAVSATTASGYSGAAPTGRYFAPANGPDCIELQATTGGGGTSGFGNCGTGSLVVTGPFFTQHDVRFAKRTSIVGNVNFEFAAELLNALNHANFTPISGIGSTTLTGYQLTGLSGTNTARTIQIVTRINW